MNHILIGEVAESLLDDIVLQFDPFKIAVFVDTLEEEKQRDLYEKIYWKFKDRLTMYAGDVQSLIKSYMSKYPDDHSFYTVSY